MTPAEIFAHARFLTKSADGDGVADTSDLIRIFNDYYLQQVVVYMNTNQDRFGIRKVTDLVANQEKYLYPSTCLRMKRAEVTFDGTNWKKFLFEDSSQVQDIALDPSSISENYSTSNPRIDFFGSYLMLRPIPATNMSGALKLWFFERPSLLISSASLFALSTFLITPQEYHLGIAHGIASEIATAQGNDTLSAAMFNRWLGSKGSIEQETPPVSLDETIDMQPDANECG